MYAKSDEGDRQANTPDSDFLKADAAAVAAVRELRHRMR